MKTENNLSFNLNWYRILQKYSPSVQKEVIFAALHYASTGELPVLKKPVSKVAFEFIRISIDEEIGTQTVDNARESVANDVLIEDSEDDVEMVLEKGEQQEAVSESSSLEEKPQDTCPVDVEDCSKSQGETKVEQPHKQSVIAKDIPSEHNCRKQHQSRHKSKTKPKLKIIPVAKLRKS